MIKFTMLLVGIISSIAMAAGLPESLPPGMYSLTRPKYNFKVTDEERAKILQRAIVWQEPAIPTSEYSFLTGELNHPDAIAPDQEVVCKWMPNEEMGGATPKFTCSTPEGLILKVKYSHKKENAEIPAEIASSRILRSLGFGGDRMYSAKKVRCFGCPKDPWGITQQMHSAFPEVRKRFYQTYGKEVKPGQYTYEPEYKKFSDFEFVTIEQRMQTAGVTTSSIKGFKWPELHTISESAGGSPRAHVEALFLMAAFLQSSDNKAENQRLICLTPIENGTCEKAVPTMQDVGATLGAGFKGLGHSKFDVVKWESAKLWKDQQNCIVEVASAPNGTFQDTKISEAGRQFAADLLNRLTRQNLIDVFTATRTAEFKGNQSVDQWVAAFEKRRALITEHKCP